jgi:uncharacterized protein (DUF983 family)
MKTKSLLGLMLMVLIVWSFAPDSFAFAQPIVSKANDFIANMLIIIRVTCIIIALAILFTALAGKISWYWITITVVVAVLVSPPGWNGIKGFLGVNEQGQAQTHSLF